MSRFLGPPGFVLGELVPPQPAAERRGLAGAVRALVAALRRW